MFLDIFCQIMHIKYVGVTVPVWKLIWVFFWVSQALSCRYSHQLLRRVDFLVHDHFNMASKTVSVMLKWAVIVHAFYHPCSPQPFNLKRFHFFFLLLTCTAPVIVRAWKFSPSLPTHRQILHWATHGHSLTREIWKSMKGVISPPT